MGSAAHPTSSALEGFNGSACCWFPRQPMCPVRMNICEIAFSYTFTLVWVFFKKLRMLKAAISEKFSWSNSIAIRNQNACLSLVFFFWTFGRPVLWSFSHLAAIEDENQLAWRSISSTFANLRGGRWVSIAKWASWFMSTMLNIFKHLISKGIRCCTSCWTCNPNHNRKYVKLWMRPPNLKNWLYVLPLCAKSRCEIQKRESHLRFESQISRIPTPPSFFQWLNATPPPGLQQEVFPHKCLRIHRIVKCGSDNYVFSLLLVWNWQFSRI